jgi:hypothetical protein
MWCGVGWWSMWTRRGPHGGSAAFLWAAFAAAFAHGAGKAGRASRRVPHLAFSQQSDGGPAARCDKLARHRHTCCARGRPCIAAAVLGGAVASACRAAPECGAPRRPPVLHMRTRRRGPTQTTFPLLLRRPPIASLRWTRYRLRQLMLHLSCKTAAASACSSHEASARTRARGAGRSGVQRRAPARPRALH